jgi:hypothetical protein
MTKKPQDAKEEGVYSSANEKDANRVKWYQKIPYWIKAVLVKYWFFGLEFYLVEMGIGSLLQDSSYAYLLMLILGFASGVFTEVFVDNILDVFENKPGQSKAYILFKSPKLYSLFINVAYGIGWGFVSMLLFGLIQNAMLVNASEESITSFGMASPLLFALLGFAVDGVIVSLKDLGVLLYHKAVHEEEE